MDPFLHFSKGALPKCLRNSIVSNYYLATSSLFDRRLVLILCLLILFHILFQFKFK